MAENQKVVAGLNGLLADATVFYQKLRHYHWNVSGREFFTLHGKFEQLYSGWAESIDQLAERILMIGGVPLHTLRTLLDASRLKEDESVPSAAKMVDAVVADLQHIATAAAEVIAAAEATGDRGTVNLLDDLMDGIQKDVWMLQTYRKDAWA